MKRETIVGFVLVVLFLFSAFPMCASARAKADFAGSGAPVAPFSPHVAFMRPAVLEGRLVSPDTPPPVKPDEQLALTFTQNFNSLSYNVTAVQQVDTYGYGPAYLLNGLTDKGYWYQVGLGFDWPYTNGGYTAGFNFFYEVWNNSGESIFPASGGGGVNSFSGSVNNGDNVLLELYFSSGNVTMYAYDWNTGANSDQTYTAVGASLFEGLTSTSLNANGFFTGLMTEWWHVNAYYGGEAEVVYSNTGFALSSGWLWADEWVPSNGTVLFFGEQYVSFSNPTQLQYFATSGAVEAASGYLFVTGGTVPSPPSASISPSSATLDVGQSELFTSNVSGGAMPYSYQWCLNGIAVGATGSTWTFVPSSSGSYTVYLNVTDALSEAATSNDALITVDSRLSATIWPFSVTVDVDESQPFTSSVTGGTPAYTYQWLLNGVVVSGATNATWTFTPTSAGTYQVYLNVTDSINVKAQSNTGFVTVNPPPSVSISPTSVAIYVSESQQFTSNVSNGTSPYAYQWYLDDVPVSGATDATWAFIPTSAGSYTVYVNVTDAAGAVATSATVPVTVITIHDVAVTDVTSSKTVVGQGYGLNVTVTAADLGDYPETFNVTVYANGNYVASQNVTLSSGNSANLTFTWNTTGLAYGNYTISAYAWPVPGETNISNNNCTGGSVYVGIPGDVEGIGKVNMGNIVAILTAFGSTPGKPNWNPNCDIENDGKIDMGDVVIALYNFGQHYP